MPSPQYRHFWFSPAWISPQEAQMIPITGSLISSLSPRTHSALSPISNAASHTGHRVSPCLTLIHWFEQNGQVRCSGLPDNSSLRNWCILDHPFLSRRCFLCDGKGRQLNWTVWLMLFSVNLKYGLSWGSLRGSFDEFNRKFKRIHTFSCQSSNLSRK